MSHCKPPYDGSNESVVAKVARRYVEDQRRMRHPKVRAMDRAVSAMERECSPLPPDVVIDQDVWDGIYRDIGEAFAAVERESSHPGGDA